MKEKIQSWITRERIYKIANVIMMLMFLPVLFCVIFIGNGMDYTDGMKMETVVSNIVLFAIAIVCAGIYFGFIILTKNFELNSKKRNLITDVTLVVAFIGVYFLNVAIAKEISFCLPWDIMVVSGCAANYANGYPMGYIDYFSMYSNNIPITYILGEVLRKVREVKNYAYPEEFIWIQVNCALMSIGGYFSCLTVKRLTKKLAPVLLTFITYFMLVAMSAWKMAPYTDTYGMIFPIMSIYFYISYREADVKWKKILYMALSLTVGMIGGFVKPNLYLIILAIMIIEFIRLVTNFKEVRLYFGISLCLLLLLFVGAAKGKEHAIDELGLDFNGEVEASWHHYFLMGLNEESTGGYNSGDVALFGQYQFSKANRNAAEIQLALERMEERGFWGSLYFWLNKMVMTFNDGAFGWRTEVWIHDYYTGLASDTPMMDFLRSIYWTGPYVGAYNTICQFVWIFVIICIPGICLSKGNKLDKYVILTTCFLGIFFYQMLFEARARYLFVFLPLLIAIAACGMDNYCSLILGRKKKTIEKIEE